MYLHTDCKWWIPVIQASHPLSLTVTCQNVEKSKVSLVVQMVQVKCSQNESAQREYHLSQLVFPSLSSSAPSLLPVPLSSFKSLLRPVSFESRSRLYTPAPAPQPLPVGDSLPAVSMVTWLLIVCSELWLFNFAGVQDENECVGLPSSSFCDVIPASCVYCLAFGNSFRTYCKIACLVILAWKWFVLGIPENISVCVKYMATDS